MQSEESGLGQGPGFGAWPTLVYAPPGAAPQHPAPEGWRDWPAMPEGGQAGWQQPLDAAVAQLQVQGQPQGAPWPQGFALPPGDVAAGGGSRLDPATLAAKLASAREKNRLAQQRFRERQREKQKAAGEQCEVLQQQIEELEGENEQLQRQNHIYEKVLAVRDAMLQTFTSLHPASPDREPASQPMRAAAQGLAKAIGELPSEGEMEAAAPRQPQPHAQREPGQAGAPGGGDQEGAPAPRDSGDASVGSGASADGVQDVQWTLADPHRSGVAAQLDGSALREVQSIPSVSSEAVRSRVVAMTEPEHMLDYYRQWQAELSVSYLAAEASGFDADSVADVEAVQDRMTQVWWHVGEMKPSYLCYLAHAALPEDSSRYPLWREIAEEVLPQMDETQRGLLRRAWHNYSKRLAKIAVGVSRWVKQLQEYAVHSPDGLVTNANRALNLVEITTHMASAVQEEYIASMEFVADQSHCTTAIQKAFINHASAPFLPDVVAIDYHILSMDAQQRRLRSAAPAQPGLLPAAPPPAAGRPGAAPGADP